MSSEHGKRVAFYGGSFDPVHVGHLEIARRLSEEFRLDEFVFVPAFHAPHKKENKPASPFHRFAMLTAVTDDEPSITVSSVELENPDHPYSIETLTKIKALMPEDEIFFVIGADSWQDITTWRRWEEVLTIVDIIVVTRPGFEIGFDHVTEKIRGRVMDLRTQKSEVGSQESESRIYITDCVNIDVSATEIRRMVREGEPGWDAIVPDPAAKHIKKYGLYR